MAWRDVEVLQLAAFENLRSLVVLGEIWTRRAGRRGMFEPKHSAREIRGVLGDFEGVDVEVSRARRPHTASPGLLGAGHKGERPPRRSRRGLTAPGGG